MKSKNNFKQGKIIEKFYVDKNEKYEVIFRYPKMSDVDGLLKYINSLVEEGARILIIKKVTRKEEIKYVKEQIKKLKEGIEISVVIEIKNKIVGMGNIRVGRGAHAHVAEMGLGLMKEYRGFGIGKRIMKTLLRLVKEK
ncbi:MAG: GNAT family N-acetyltransferase [Candidatus Aenigmatarchaeota archaeon]